uniref:T-cell receptor T3 zeta chain n=1 Tax=Heterorhabditis bacteriophora TaxID=37862 RepID=A0A1I7X4U8_HETBA
MFGLVNYAVKMMLFDATVLLPYILMIVQGIRYERKCSYCRDSEVYSDRSLYSGLRQKMDTGPLKSYPCINDLGQQETLGFSTSATSRRVTAPEISVTDLDILRSRFEANYY